MRTEQTQTLNIETKMQNTQKYQYEAIKGRWPSWRLFMAADEKSKSHKGNKIVN